MLNCRKERVKHIECEEFISKILRMDMRTIKCYSLVTKPNESIILTIIFCFKYKSVSFILQCINFDSLRCDLVKHTTPVGIV